MPSTPGTLAALVRAKHPGAYDDMDDATLESAVTAKYPGAYDDVPRSTLPTRPVSAEDFAKPSKGWPAKLGDYGVGIVKGLGSTAVGIAETAVNAGLTGGTPAMFAPEYRNPLFTQLEKDTTASNTDQRIGKGLETAAELAVPAYEVGKVGVSLAKAVPALAKKIGPVGMEIASHVPVIGGPFRAARTISKVMEIADRIAGKEAPTISNAGGKLAGKASKTSAEAELSKMIEELRAPERASSVELPPAAELPPGYEPRTTVPNPIAKSAPESGRLVKAPARAQVEQELAAAIEDLRKPSQPARITTPPPADLPAGYTPRTSAPKLKIAPKAAETPTPAPKRAYFLKPESEMASVADEAAVEPADLTDPLSLPSSWRQRVDQDLMPMTGADEGAIVSQLRQHLLDSGASIGDALTAVAKNPDLPTKVRTQLIAALTKTRMRK